MSSGEYNEIHIACAKCGVEKVSDLIEDGANPNALGKFGSTPLHVSAMEGCARTTSLLLSNGANPNVFNAFRNTPMQVAAREGHVRVLDELIDSGAYLTGTGALFYAAEAGNIECVERILEIETRAVVFDGPSGQKEDRTPINWEYQLAPELNVQPNGTEPDLNPLHAAVRFENKVRIGETPGSILPWSKESVENLVDLVFSFVGTTDPRKYQRSPLATAASIGAPVATERLLEHGFPPNYSNSDQPLNRACRSETGTHTKEPRSTASCEVAKTLVEYGANLQRVNDDVPASCTRGGETPLTEAVKGDSEIKGDSIKCVQYLAHRISEKGDLPFKYNDQGLKPIHVAALYDSPRSVKPLMDAGSNIEAQVKNPDRNQSWFSGTTPVHLAAFENNAGVIEALIQAGVDPNCVDPSDGDTPLHLAVAHFSSKAESVLLDAGADPEIANDSGETPLDYKQSRGYSGGSPKSSSTGSEWQGDWLKTDGQWIHRDQL